MTYKIIQWATGSKGMIALREVIRHPDLKLVGLRVYDPAKVGRDAGDIAGTPPTGVIATDQLDAILATDADCVLYMAQVQYPMDVHDHNICQLLASGKNVIASTGYYWPPTHGNEYVDRFEQACRMGKSTLFGTGFSPGHFTERLAVQMTEACVRVDSIHYLEVCDCSNNKASIVVDVMGCGKLPQEVTLEGPTAQLTNHYHYEVLASMAHQLGVTLEAKRTELETMVALRDETLPSGVLIRKGTVGATARRWIGIVNGQPFITCESRWTVVKHIPGWEPDNYWQITIEGEPALRMQLRNGETFGPIPITAKEYPTFVMCAAPVIRAIPAVLEAPPGILKATTFSPWSERMARSAKR
jgi:hypothetical protein